MGALFIGSGVIGEAKKTLLADPKSEQCIGLNPPIRQPIQPTTLLYIKQSKPMGLFLTLVYVLVHVTVGVSDLVFLVC